MNFAAYNPTTNRILTWVTEPKGSLPDGYEFRAEADVPPGAQVEVQQPPPTPVPVPESVSLRQFRMALKRSGLFATVDGLRTNQALTTQQRDDLTEFLEFSNQIERSHMLIESLSPMVGVTSGQIDDLFRLADTL